MIKVTRLSPRLITWALNLTLNALLVAGAANAEEWRNPVWPQSRIPTDGAQRVNLMNPTKDFLSGRAWLTAEGLDPGLADRPGWDTLTRLDWSDLPPNPAGQSAPASPSLQAVGAAALVPFRNPAPAFSRDILISRDFGGIPIQTEPHIAVNPNNPDHLVAGMIDYNFPSLSTYVSLDGGQAWEGPFQVPYHIEDLVSGGDPVLAFDRSGAVYITGISIGVEEFALGPIYFSDQVSSITVARSDDGGYSWPMTVSTARSRIRMVEHHFDDSGVFRGTISVGFLDKPWLTVGPHPRRPERDVLYLTYTEFETHYSISWIGELPALTPSRVATTIRLVTSEDGGRTWSTPVAVSETVVRTFGEGGDSEGFTLLGADRVVQGPQPAVGPDGELYVVWLDSTEDGSFEGLGEIHVARSDDAGKTFGPPTVAATFNEIGFRPRNSFFRYWGASFPQVDVAPDGTLFIAYTARPADKVNDDGDIFVVRSTDGGYSFGRPRRINGDRGSALQFFPSISVGPDGEVHVMWLDMRDDPSQIRYHVYYTRSEDNGRTWGFELEEFGFTVEDTRVSDFSSNANRGFSNGLFIGDYVSIKAVEDDVYMVWPDTRLGEFGGINQKIGFARQRPVRSPEIYVQPAAGSGGQKITVQGFDFQPDMNVFVQLQDTTIATARTNQEGRFTASIFIPVTSEGAQDLRVFDESGNMSTASFYTEFGFGNIQDLYQELLTEIRDLKRALEAANGGK